MAFRQLLGLIFFMVEVVVFVFFLLVLLPFLGGDGRELVWNIW